MAVFGELQISVDKTAAVLRVCVSKRPESTGRSNAWRQKTGFRKKNDSHAQITNVRNAKTWGTGPYLSLS